MPSTRREFLHTAAAVPLVAPIIPLTLLGTQDKAGSKKPVMGTGAYTYEADHDWGKLPAGLAWGNTHSVMQDAQGHMYVQHTVHATSDKQGKKLHGAFRADGVTFVPVGKR